MLTKDSTKEHKRHIINNRYISNNLEEVVLSRLVAVITSNVGRTIIIPTRVAPAVGGVVGWMRWIWCQGDIVEEK